MNPPSERDLATALAQEYQRQGYQVLVQPGPEHIPFSLDNYRPDLLAEKADEHLLVEIRNHSTPVSIGRLQRITETVKQHPGWRFLFVNSGPDTYESVPQSPLAWPAITDRLQQARRLREAGNPEAAILLSWSAFEALLRRHAESVDLPLEHASVPALLDYLYSEADLSYEHFEQAKQLLAGRNRLAHGFPLPEASQHAAQLQGLLDDLSADWLPLREAA